MFKNQYFIQTIKLNIINLIFVLAYYKIIVNLKTFKQLKNLINS